MKAGKLVRKYKNWRFFKIAKNKKFLIPVASLFCVFAGTAIAALTAGSASNNNIIPPSGSNMASNTNLGVTKLKTPTPKPGNQLGQSNKISCSQIEGTLDQTYKTDLADDWSAWSASTYLTASEINYEYNQAAKYAYELYSQSMENYGCAPQLSLDQKSPAVAPDFSVSKPPASMPTIPTCNETAEAIYTSDYDNGVNAENQRYETLAGQISAAIGQVGVDGGGSSSAMELLLQDQASNNAQHQSKLNSLKETYQEELSQIGCAN